MRIKIAVSVCAVALALGTPQARANGLAGGGTIIGIFSDPIYSGFVTHDPTISSPPVYFNNSATAPLSTFIVNRQIQLWRARHLCRPPEASFNGALTRWWILRSNSAS
jgi:hypothetical protein